MKKIKYILSIIGIILLVFVIYLSIDGFSIFRDPEKVVAEQHKPLKQEDINKKISAAALHKDMDFLLKTIEAVGVNPYLNISKEEFLREFDSVKYGINHPLTVKEFYQRIAPLVNSLKDSHTSFFWNDFQAYYSKKGEKFFPMSVEVTIDGKIIVDHDCSPNHLNKGVEILSINDISSSEIIKKILTFEKGATLYPRVKTAQENFEWLLWEVFDFTAPFKIQTNDQTVTVQGIPQAEIKKWKKPIQQSNQGISYKKLSQNAGLLTVKTFFLNPDEFSNSMKKSFSSIQKDSITNLIIDIRDNGGGNEINGNILINYIWDKPYRMSSKFMRKKSEQWISLYWQMYKWWIRPLLSFDIIASMNDEAKVMFGTFGKTPVGKINIVEMPEIQPGENPIRFNGNVYILINHNVGSAAVGFVGAVKDYHIAKLIGEETGENTNGFGELYPFDLPNSRLFVYASTTFMLRPSGNSRMTIGELPDYQVLQKSGDSDKGTDTVLEFVKEMIRGLKNR
jgi:hypothetical protein